MIILDIGDDLEKAEKYMEDIYENIINDDYALTQYGKFIDHLLVDNDQATLWHCTAGKDRAGFATVLVLECLGIDRETIISDYLLTNEYVKNDVHKMIKTIKSEHPNLTNVDNVVKALFGIKRRYLENIYDFIKINYGSMREFLKIKINVTDEKLNLMQKLYLK